MKKYFIFVMFAAMAMTTSFLTACSSDENESNNNETTGVTEFSASVEQMTVTDAKGFLLNEGTRTSLDTAYQFYWENGDKIFVKKGSTWHPSSALNLTEKRDFAKFTVNEAFTEDAVDLVYTGNGANVSATQVTIAASQTQKSWNVSTHLGTSGDCGTAIAGRDNLTGKYTFTLTHQAAYLIFYPYLDSSQSGYNLTSIDIESENGTQLAGTFGFSMSGLATTATSSGTNKITLTLGNNGAGLPLQNIQPTTKANGTHCYAVIHPGNHKLKVTYHVVNASNSSDKFDIEQSLSLNGNPRTFSPNGVSIITYKLKKSLGDFYFVFEDTYYMWDAQKWVWDGVPNFPTKTTDRNDNYPREGDLRYFNMTEVVGAEATNPAFTDLPNANELYWYIVNGDPRWDANTKWTLASTTQNIFYEGYKGGVWIKKKAAILADNTLPNKCSHGYTFCSEHDKDGVDMRSVYKSVVVNSDSYKYNGKPADTSDYFYLPCLGHYDYSQSNFIAPKTNGAYWATSTIYPGPVQTWNHRAYGLNFSLGSIYTGTGDYRLFGYVAGQRPEWHSNRSWFQ